MAKRNGGSEPISISFDAQTITVLDFYCNEKMLDRSSVVRRALWRFILSELADEPQMRDRVYYKAVNNEN